jgi:hypothetical protein
MARYVFENNLTASASVESINKVSISCFLAPFANIFANVFPASS